MVNITPTFMRLCLQAVRSGYKLYWVMHNIAKEMEEPITEELLQSVCDRPKTPRRVEVYGYAERWLARYFTPVYEAYLDGHADEELLLKWRCTDRKDSGKYSPRLSSQERRRGKANQYFLRVRERDTRRAWHTVK